MQKIKNKLNDIFSHTPWFLSALENRSWEKQLYSLVERMSTPVLIANTDHEIIYANDKFNRLPIAALLAQYDSLPALLWVFEFASVAQDKENIIKYYKKTLDGLTAKIRTRVTWKGFIFEWILNPLFSASGKRMGTLVECACQQIQPSIENEKSKKLPLAPILDQLAVPFLFVDQQEQVAYVNLSLKMILIRHHIFLQDKSPELNLYDPTGDSLSHFLKLGENPLSFSDARKQGLLTINLRAEQYQLTFQSLWDTHHESIGTVVLWQEVTSLMAKEEKHNDKNRLEKDLTSFTSGIAKLHLYQKEAHTVMEYFRPEDYDHILLKNSAKIVQQLGHSLQKLYNEVRHLKSIIHTRHFSERSEALPGEKFNTMALENELSMKKAEDVLLEGMTKSNESA